MERKVKQSILLVNHFFAFSICLILAGCAESLRHKKVFRQEQYHDGTLKSEGYYINDSIPVDTLKVFWPNGNKKAVEVYNSFGEIDGLCSYYDDEGELIQRRNYVDGELNGYILNYFENSMVKSKVWANDGILQGDAIEYYLNNKPKLYNFYDFQQKNCLVREYDSITRSYTAREGNHIIVDSVEDKVDSLIFRILVAHPPFTSNQLLFEELNDSMQTLKKYYLNDTVPIIKFSLLKYKGLANIRITASQFDSILNSTFTVVSILKSKKK